MRLEALRIELGGDPASRAAPPARGPRTAYDGVLGAEELEALETLRADLAPSVADRVLAAAQRVDLMDASAWRSDSRPRRRSTGSGEPSEGLTLADAPSVAVPGPAAPRRWSRRPRSRRRDCHLLLERLEPFQPRTWSGSPSGSTTSS